MPATATTAPWTLLSSPNRMPGLFCSNISCGGGQTHDVTARTKHSGIYCSTLWLWVRFAITSELWDHVVGEPEEFRERLIILFLSDDLCSTTESCCIQWFDATQIERQLIVNTLTFIRELSRHYVPSWMDGQIGVDRWSPTNSHWLAVLRGAPNWRAEDEGRR